MNSNSELFLNITVSSTSQITLAGTQQVREQSSESSSSSTSSGPRHSQSGLPSASSCSISSFQSAQTYLLNLPEPESIGVPPVLGIQTASNVFTVKQALFSQNEGRNPSIRLGTQLNIEHSPSEPTPSTKRSIAERWMMPIEALLNLLQESEQKDGFFDDTSTQIDDLDMFGLLAEEENAIHDEYIEKKHLETIDQQHQFPRRITRHSSSSSSSSSSSESTPVLQPESEEEDDGEEPEVIITGATTALVHDKYIDDEQEHLTIEEIFQSIVGRSQTQLGQEFKRHLDSVLPMSSKRWIHALMTKFEADLSSGIHIATEADVTSTEESESADHIYRMIVRSLIYSACSESECERIFSKAKHISGKRRHNLLLETLNQALCIIYLSPLF